MVPRFEQLVQNELCYGEPFGCSQTPGFVIDAKDLIFRGLSDSMEECRFQCLSHSSCEVFRFGFGNNTCELGTKLELGAQGLSHGDFLAQNLPGADPYPQDDAVSYVSRTLGPSQKEAPRYTLALTGCAGAYSLEEAFASVFGYLKDSNVVDDSLRVLDEQSWSAMSPTLIETIFRLVLGFSGPLAMEFYVMHPDTPSLLKGLKISFEACSAMCSRRGTHCSGFFYSKSNQTCFLGRRSASLTDVLRGKCIFNIGAEFTRLTTSLLAEFGNADPNVNVTEASKFLFEWDGDIPRGLDLLTRDPMTVDWAAYEEDGTFTQAAGDFDFFVKASPVFGRPIPRFEPLQGYEGFGGSYHSSFPLIKPADNDAIQTFQVEPLRGTQKSFVPQETRCAELCLGEPSCNTFWIVFDDDTQLFNCSFYTGTTYEFGQLRKLSDGPLAVADDEIQRLMTITGFEDYYPTSQPDLELLDQLLAKSEKVVLLRNANLDSCKYSCAMDVTCSTFFFAENVCLHERWITSFFSAANVSKILGLLQDVQQYERSVQPLEGSSRYLPIEGAPGAVRLQGSVEFRLAARALTATIALPQGQDCAALCDSILSCRFARFHDDQCLLAEDGVLTPMMDSGPTQNGPEELYLSTIVPAESVDTRYELGGVTCQKPLLQYSTDDSVASNPGFSASLCKAVCHRTESCRAYAVSNTSCTLFPYCGVLALPQQWWLRLRRCLLRQRSLFQCPSLCVRQDPLLFRMRRTDTPVRVPALCVRTAMGFGPTLRSLHASIFCQLASLTHAIPPFTALVPRCSSIPWHSQKRSSETLPGLVGSAQRTALARSEILPPRELSCVRTRARKKSYAERLRFVLLMAYASFLIVSSLMLETKTTPSTCQNQLDCTLKFSPKCAN